MVGHSKIKGSSRIKFKIGYSIFQNPLNGYVIARGTVDGQPKGVVAKGYFGPCQVGDEVELEGEWVADPKYGQQFSGNSTSQSTTAAHNPLLSLVEKAGVKDKKLTDFIKRISPSFSLELASNPYLLLDYQGIHWDTADKLAEAAEIAPDSLIRITAGFQKLLKSFPSREMDKEKEQSAGCWATMTSIIPEAARLLSLPRSVILEALPKTYPALKLINQPTQAIMDSKLVEAEDVVEGKVGVLMNTFSPAVPITSLSGGLSEEQAAAVYISCHQNISAITGPPGTGKTRCIAEIARLHALQNETVYLAAPTGKAAFRLGEVTRYGENWQNCLPPTTSTIHRLLGCVPSVPEGFHFTRNEEYPLESATIIIDEASMIDTKLMASLMRAIGENSKLILVGDINQLSPVGPGQPFKDLIKSQAIPVHYLSTIFRQVAGSAIAEACRIVIEGEAHELFKFLRSKEAQAEIEYIPIKEDSEIEEKVVHVYHNSLSGVDQIILCPMNKNEGGSFQLNQIIQTATTSHRPRFEVGEGFGGINDRDPVMQIKNNYNRAEKEGIFNGDIGTAHVYNRTGTSNQLGLNVRFLGNNMLESYSQQQAKMELKLAYAISIHKSQGSEWQQALITVPYSARNFLNRTMLYTAFSRAKRRLVLMANPAAIQVAMGQRSEVVEARTRLGVRLGKTDCLNAIAA